MFSPLPFSPIRASLYTPQDLMGSSSRRRTIFIRAHRRFRMLRLLRECTDVPRRGIQLSSLFEALHDNSITQATIALL